MAPYKYDTPEPSPLIGSIADIIQKQGALQGMQATQLAEITAKSAAVRGANWGQAVQSLGQLPMQVMEQNRRDQIANMDALYKTQQMQVSQASLQDAQQQRARKYAAGLALNKAIGDAKDPDSGEVDPQKVVDAIGGNFPEETAAWAKSYNDMAAAHTARAKSQKADQEQEDIYVGRLAHDADSAADFVDRLATGQAAHYVSKKTLDRVTDDLAKTNAWDPLKGQYVKRASTLLGPVKLGDTLYDPITNEPMLSDEKPTKVGADEALVGRNPDGTPKVIYQGGAKKPSVSYTPEQIAIAKSNGHDEPTLGDIQTADAAKSARERADALAKRRIEVDNPMPSPKPPAPPGGKPLSTADLAKVTEADKALEEINTLRASLKPGTTGLGASVAASLPPFMGSVSTTVEQAKEAQAQIDRVRQVAGRQIHGGVLRKNDIEEAKKYLPAIGDPPELVTKKLDALEKMIRDGRAAHLNNLGKGGYNVSPYQAADTVGPDEAPAAAATPPRIPRFNPATGKLE